MVEDPLPAARYGFQPETVEIEEPFSWMGRSARASPSLTAIPPPAGWRRRCAGCRASAATPRPTTQPGAIAVSVFGTVLQALRLAERPDVLGHRIRWAFGSPHLLVVPYAGVWANAFNDRYSQSLQFFTFPAREGRLVYTTLSRHIVAHETGHAVLDALAPALYDALTPQTLGLHEAIADLTAIVMARLCSAIHDWLIRENRARLQGDRPVSQLAAKFGWARYLANGRSATPTTRAPSTRRATSRTSWRRCSLARLGGDGPAPRCPGARPRGRRVRPRGPTAAGRGRAGPRRDDPPHALAISSLRIARILFRALDYLPPAEATFADYARAVLRSDSVSYQQDETGYRATLAGEFVRRGIVRRAGDLEAEPPRDRVGVELEEVLGSDWAAYQFANRERALLSIPPGVPFRLFPRRDVRRRYYLGDGRHETRREVILQATWEQAEDNDGFPPILRLPPRRAVFHGTTLVVSGTPEPDGRYPVLSCLTSDRSDEHVDGRNETLRRLAESGRLGVADTWEAFTARYGVLAPETFSRVSGDLLRLRGTTRRLHLEGEPALPTPSGRAGSR
jgi:hypothetical protein